MKMKLLMIAAAALLVAVHQCNAASGGPVRLPAVISSEQCSPSTVGNIVDTLRDRVAQTFDGIGSGSGSGSGVNEISLFSQGIRPDTWTSVASLNMSNPSMSCPDGWKTIEEPVRACTMTPPSVFSITHGKCASAFFPTNVSYTQVCGRINAYQYGAPDAFWNYLVLGFGLDTYYVDGVSITHGPESSRQHVWTFANSWTDTNGVTNGADGCSCMYSSPSEWGYSVPGFVGNNYFCSTADADTETAEIHTNKVLWNGVGCTGSNKCCQFNQPPWFCRTLPTATSDALEVRICIFIGTDEENIYITDLDLYVK